MDTSPIDGGWLGVALLATNALSKTAEIAFNAIEGTSIGDITSMINVQMTQPMVGALSIDCDTIEVTRAVEVPDSMVISEVSRGPQFFTDSAAPRPRTWNISGYVKSLLPILENGFFLKPTLILQRKYLDYCAYLRKPVFFKSNDGEMLDVLIQSIKIRDNATMQSGYKIDIQVKEFVNMKVDFVSGAGVTAGSGLTGAGSASSIATQAFLTSIMPVGNIAAIATMYAVPMVLDTANNVVAAAKSAAAGNVTDAVIGFVGAGTGVPIKNIVDAANATGAYLPMSSQSENVDLIEGYDVSSGYDDSGVSTNGGGSDSGGAISAGPPNIESQKIRGVPILPLSHVSDLIRDSTFSYFPLTNPVTPIDTTTMRPEGDGAFTLSFSLTGGGHTFDVLAKWNWEAEVRRNDRLQMLNMYLAYNPVIRLHQDMFGGGIVASVPERVVDPYIFDENYNTLIELLIDFDKNVTNAIKLLLQPWTPTYQPNPVTYEMAKVWQAKSNLLFGTLMNKAYFQAKIGKDMIAFTKKLFDIYPIFGGNYTSILPVIYNNIDMLADIDDNYAIGMIGEMKAFSANLNDFQSVIEGLEDKMTWVLEITSDFTGDDVRQLILRPNSRYFVADPLYNITASCGISRVGFVDLNNVVLIVESAP